MTDRIYLDDLGRRVTDAESHQLQKNGEERSAEL